MVTQIQSIMDDTNQNYKTVSHPTIFHHILESDLSPQEKELSRLAQEGQTIVGAGTETTAWTMSVITYYVLSNPQIKERLLHELKGAMITGKTTCNQLEQLPYFSAVISEGLRLSHGGVYTLAESVPRSSLELQRVGDSACSELFISNQLETYLLTSRIDSSQYDVCSHPSEPINISQSKRVHARQMD